MNSRTKLRTPPQQLVLHKNGIIMQSMWNENVLISRVNQLYGTNIVKTTCHTSCYKISKWWYLCQYMFLYNLDYAHSLDWLNLVKLICNFWLFCFYTRTYFKGFLSSTHHHQLIINPTDKHGSPLIACQAGKRSQKDQRIGTVIGIVTCIKV